MVGPSDAWVAAEAQELFCRLPSTSGCFVPRYTVLRLMIRQRLEEIAETPETI
jgi:hypothetical protein